MGGFFSFIEVSVNIGRALQDDFIFRKIFDELIDGVAGFGDGAGVGKQASFAEAEPREVGRFCSLGGVEILIEVAREGPIEGVADEGHHPR